jgi:hypothetical protein
LGGFLSVAAFDRFIVQRRHMRAPRRDTPCARGRIAAHDQAMAGAAVANKFFSRGCSVIF